MSQSNTKAVINDGVITPTAPGWNPGDSVVRTLTGTVDQIGRLAGANVLLPDPRTLLSVIGFGLHAFVGPLTFLQVAGNQVRITGGVVRQNGQAPAGPALVTVNVVIAAPETISDVTVVTGKILSFLLNAAGDTATVTLYTDVAGAFNVLFLASGAAAATWDVYTNADQEATNNTAFPA